MTQILISIDIKWIDEVDIWSDGLYIRRIQTNDLTIVYFHNQKYNSVETN
jgi:hypothetical protein